MDHISSFFLGAKNMVENVQFSSICRIWLFATPWLQHARPPCRSPTPRVDSNSCPLSQCCHPTISSSVIPFSSRLKAFPGSGSFQMSQFFASGGQTIGVSASASVLPMDVHDWFRLGLTGWIALQSKGLSRAFSNTTVQRHMHIKHIHMLYTYIHNPYIHIHIYTIFSDYFPL